MKSVNIPRSVEDPKYRYKMPLLQIKHEGKGIGHKTALPNLSEVALALRTSAEYIIKFIGYEMSTQIIHKKKGGEETFHINGTQKDEEVRLVLDKFIDKYVLCKGCTYPEMYLILDNSKIKGKCNSCGHESELDNKHKIVNFIIKNPPKNLTEINKKADDNKEGENVNRKRVNNNDEEKYEIRRYLAQNIVNKGDPILSKIVAYIKGRLRGNIPEIDKLYYEIKRLKIPKEQIDRVGYIYFNILFDNLLNGIKNNVGILKNVLIRNKIKKLYEYDILMNIQEYYSINKNIINQVPTVLKLMMDYDVLSEDFLVNWNNGNCDEILAQHFLYNNDFNRVFKKEAQPFLNWLMLINK